MTTISDVTAMLPLVTRYSMPEDQTAAGTLYLLAEARVSADAPGLSDTNETLAYCYYIAHLMSGQQGRTGITSEHLGQWSVSYSSNAAENSTYLVEYYRLIGEAGISVCDVVRHNDADYAEDYGNDSAYIGGMF